MEVNVNGNDKLIEPHFSMIIAGPSGCGKSTFIYNLLVKLPEILPPEKQFSKVLYCYGVYQDFYDRLASLSNVELIEGLPNIENPGCRTLIIIDDLFLESNKQLATMFIRQRHLNVSTIFVVHNFFHECKYMRTITRNANYLVLFKNPRDMCQIAYMSRQMYPRNKGFLCEAFALATERPYGYLFVDLKPTTEEQFRLKTGLFSKETLEYYVKSA